MSKKTSFIPYLPRRVGTRTVHGVLVDIFKPLSENYYIIAAIARPEENLVRIGGVHTDSPLPLQKWQSLDEAIDKVARKAVCMEIKCRIHRQYDEQGNDIAGCKFGIYTEDTSFLLGT